jgi:hypothetical protein
MDGVNTKIKKICLSLKSENVTLREVGLTFQSGWGNPALEYSTNRAGGRA